MMSGIRGRNTRPEVAVRKGLHALGFRFRLHRKTLPGTPDLVLPRHRAVIFVNGCFWHGHDCALFRLPDTRREFWEAKITRNRERDTLAVVSLETAGWRVGIIWECAIRGRLRTDMDGMLTACRDWLLEGDQRLEIRGRS